MSPWRGCLNSFRARNPPKITGITGTAPHKNGNCIAQLTWGLLPAWSGSSNCSVIDNRTVSTTCTLIIRSFLQWTTRHWSDRGDDRKSCTRTSHFRAQVPSFLAGRASGGAVITSRLFGTSKAKLSVPMPLLETKCSHAFPATVNSEGRCFCVCFLATVNDTNAPVVCNGWLGNNGRRRVIVGCVESPLQRL